MLNKLSTIEKGKFTTFLISQCKEKENIKNYYYRQHRFYKSY